MSVTNFDAALRHVKEWTTLTTVFSGCARDWTKGMAIGTIPALAELHMEDCGESYHLPALKRLRTSGDPSKLASVMSQLTVLSLSINFEARDSYHQLISSLSLGSKLRDLSLTYGFLSVNGLVNIRDAPSPLYLPLVESFSVCLDYGSGVFPKAEKERHSDAMSFVTRTIIVPKVEFLEVIIQNHSHTEEEEYFSWEDLFPPERAYPCLRSLSFSVRPARSSPGAALVQRLVPGLLRNFPQAQTLSLSPTGLFTDCPALADLARLRKITFGDCEIIDRQIRSLLVAILDQDVVNVESIAIIPRTGAPRHPRFWTEDLRKKLNMPFCVECT